MSSATYPEFQKSRYDAVEFDAVASPEDGKTLTFYAGRPVYNGTLGAIFVDPIVQMMPLCNLKYQSHCGIFETA